jgi:hypothetical protein
MRYQACTAVARWCTERTAWGALIVAVIIGAPACRGGASDERASQGAITDTRTARDSSMSRANAKPACPATGAWQLCSVLERLDRAGLAPRQEPGRALEPPLSSPGVTVRLGNSELRIFLYADRAARERDQAKLDRTNYVAADQELSMRAEPTLIVSENLLAILRSQNDHQRERVSDALTAGPPQRPRPRD